MISRRKPGYDVSPGLASYLTRYGRTLDLPGIYEDMTLFVEKYPLYDKEGRETLWQTAMYDSFMMKSLHHELTRVYSLLKTGEEPDSTAHLYIERVDYCEFGNSRPFRVRVVNHFNDNYDHFYVKTADASRIYGLELEHVLSPNRINFMVNRGTLIEEHIVGIPGDVFIKKEMSRGEYHRVRLAKEFVKFTERCFIRLLGDMRSYNYVVDVSQDIEDMQFRVRAIDFDQQSHAGKFDIYLPQRFAENEQVVNLCAELLNYTTMQQYQREERSLIARRVSASSTRLSALLECMKKDEIAPAEYVSGLAEALGKHHQTDVFQSAKTMGDLVEANLHWMLKDVHDKQTTLFAH